MPVTYTFGSATAPIPLANLDSNFATPITLGNTAIQLGNTVTTLNNMTLANATVSSGNVTVTSASLSGNLTFTGTGNRITGDFSNATPSNRVLFQTSTTNNQTATGLLPNGTSTQSQFAVYNGSDPLNASQGRLLSNASEFRIENLAAGTGTYLPMTFYTNGSERMRVDTSGNVGIGTSSPSYPLTVVSATSSGVGLAINGRSSDNIAGAYWFANNGSTQYGTITASASEYRISSIPAAAVQTFYTNSSERMRIDSSGNVLVTNPAGLGYGTGSGGAVTQATSRTTGVTLNKPTGAITMFSAAGSATAATFTVTNSVVAATDTIILNQKSGTNLYVFLVTAVAAGSFNITFYTTGGTATDAPVINFSVIKGATA